ncbi:MAG: hypothetical protein ABSG36_19045 [Acidimicrobiales bacterium]
MAPLGGAALRDRSQIMIGLLGTSDGIPIAHHVFAGKTAPSPASASGTSLLPRTGPHLRGQPVPGQRP